MPFVVRADSKWKTFNDFVADCKKNPGKYKVANSTTGSATHLAAIAMTNAAGCKVIHLPLGIKRRNAGVLSGEADAMAAPLTGAIRLARAGKFRILAVPSEKRNAVIPDVPTMKELGYSAVLDLFRGLSVPKGTPAAVKAKLADAMMKAARSPAFMKLAEKKGFTVEPMDSKRLQRISEQNGSGCHCHHEERRNLSVQEEVGGHPSGTVRPDQRRDGPRAFSLSSSPSGAPDAHERDDGCACPHRVRRRVRPSDERLDRTNASQHAGAVLPAVEFDRLPAGPIRDLAGSGRLLQEDRRLRDTTRPRRAVPCGRVGRAAGLPGLSDLASLHGIPCLDAALLRRADVDVRRKASRTALRTTPLRSRCSFTLCSRCCFRSRFPPRD